MTARDPAADPRTTVLRLTGADALSLLHRLSTNSVADLAPGQARATLFCDLRGRLLHRALLGVTGDRATWLVRPDAPGAPLAEFLERHVFRDAVQVADHSLGLFVRPTERPADLAPGTLHERRGVPVLLAVATGETVAIEDAAPGPPPVSAPEEERRRIAAGRPAHGHEIRDAFTPFEVGLAHELHLDKGCFTGQEALRRLVTYRGVRRRLARVRGDGPPPVPPAELVADGRPAGVLTSAVPDGGAWIGLAVLRHEACDPACGLELAGAGRIGPPEPLPLTRPLGRDGPGEPSG